MYHAWRTGKKSLSEMTDGDLQKFDDYLHIVLVGREFRRLEVEMKPSRRRVPVKAIVLLPAVLLFVIMLYSLVRGIR